MISDLLANCCNARSLLGAAALATLVACAPSDIATGSCHSIMMATGDPWECTVKGAIVGRRSSITFDTESRNQIAEVDFELRVTKGSLRVYYGDLTGARQIVVTPSEPASVAMKTKMNPRDRSFTMHFEPVGGRVEGLTGTVKYKTP